MNNRKAWIKLFLILLPGIIGFIGFLQAEDTSLSWILYHCVELYLFETGTENVNLLIEVARWLAPVATTGVVLTVFWEAGMSLRNRMVALRSRSCTVLGDDEYADCLLKELGRDGIAGDERACRTQTCVLMYLDESKNMEYYSRHKQELEGKRVYIRVSELGAFASVKKNLHPFSIKDYSAMNYWKNYPLKGNEKIALIGNSSLTDWMLKRSLLLNIVNEGQCIEYHIWQENEVFSRRHRYLDQITMDKLIFHENEILSDLHLLEQMDRIILTDTPEQNRKILLVLLQSLPKKRIDVYTYDEEVIYDLFGTEYITCFGDKHTMASREILLQEGLLKKAKALNEHYRKLYGGKRWNELTGFFQQSNISAAGYFDVINRLHEEGVSDETLMKLEHIRWSRFYILNNWSYASVRDDESKKHNCLVPFDKLTENEKSKDMDSIKLAYEFAEGQTKEGDN